MTELELGNSILRKYYSICASRLGNRAHLIGILDRTKLAEIIDTDSINIYMREHDGMLVAKDIVIGAGDGDTAGAHGAIIVSANNAEYADVSARDGLLITFGSPQSFRTANHKNMNPVMIF